MNIINVSEDRSQRSDSPPLRCRVGGGEGGGEGGEAAQHQHQLYPVKTRVHQQQDHLKLINIIRTLSKKYIKKRSDPQN